MPASASAVRAALCAAALVGVSPPLAAQPEGGPVGLARVAALVENPNLPRDIDPVFAPPLVTRPHLDREPADPVPATPAASAPSALTDFRLSQTDLPKIGDRGFGNHDTDLSAQVALPWEPLGKPLLLKGGFGAHAWDGATRGPRGGDPGLPGTVYDFFLDLAWKPRPAEWLFLDLGITPGFYSDLHAFPHEAFRLRGRALAVVALSEMFQFVGGALYVNRNEKKLVPAGGFVWAPDDETKFQVVFPQPKVARRVGSVGGSAWWVYAAGEFGGGTWAYERPDGTPSSVDYNDYRVILGSEFRRVDGWTLRFETGYVWGRELLPLDGPRVTPTDTTLLRLALVY